MSRLSDTLHAAASSHDGDPLDLEVDLDVLHARAGARRRRRARARVGLCVASAVLALGATGVAAGAGGGRDDVRAEGPGVEDGTSTTAAPESTDTTDPGSTTTTEPTPSTEATTTTEAPSTTVTPTTEVPPPTTPPTGPTTLTLHGTYVGTGRTGFGDQGCEQLSGDMRLDVTMDDGSHWDLDEDVCARVVDDMWVGEGTFVLTDPDGQTLTGPHVLTTPMGTPGVPYTLPFTGGTGAYSGATGQCDVTITIEPPGGIEQMQRGEVSCTITLAAGGDSAEGEVPGSV